MISALGNCMLWIWHHAVPRWGIELSNNEKKVHLMMNHLSSWFSFYVQSFMSANANGEKHFTLTNSAQLRSWGKKPLSEHISDIISVTRQCLSDKLSDKLSDHLAVGRQRNLSPTCMLKGREPIPGNVSPCREERAFFAHISTISIFFVTRSNLPFLNQNLIQAFTFDIMKKS